MKVINGVLNIGNEEITITEADILEQKSKEYIQLRKNEYNKLNQFEMQSDDALNGTTTWIDAIKEIKAKYPKPEVLNE